MNYSLVGIIGSIILIAGAATPPVRVSHPLHSAKNWLFLFGGLWMRAYSLFLALAGGPFFFVILQLLVNFASVLMMANTSDRLDTFLITFATVACIMWSLLLYEDWHTLIFILGLGGIAMGYAFETGSYRRTVALTVGSVLLAAYSYSIGEVVFLYLNFFFALFSGMHVFKFHQNTGRK